MMAILTVEVPRIRDAGILKGFCNVDNDFLRRNDILMDSTKQRLLKFKGFFLDIIFEAPDVRRFVDLPH